MFVLSGRRRAVFFCGGKAHFSAVRPGRVFFLLFGRWCVFCCLAFTRRFFFLLGRRRAFCY